MSPLGLVRAVVVVVDPPFLDDVDARVRAAVENGAELCMPVFDIPTVGRIAILQDVTGSLIGWMTPAP